MTFYLIIVEKGRRCLKAKVLVTFDQNNNEQKKC